MIAPTVCQMNIYISTLCYEAIKSPLLTQSDGPFVCYSLDYCKDLVTGPGPCNQGSLDPYDRINSLSMNIYISTLCYEAVNGP